MAKFKLGDRVTVVSRALLEGIVFTIENVGENTAYPYSLSGDTSPYINAWDDDELELVTKGGEMKPYQRKTYRLKKAMPGIKAGALFQEECDDGTQPYKIINAREVAVYPEDGTLGGRIRNRKIVEDDPQWFEEVFKVEPEYMTREELDKWEAFKGKKKPGRKPAAKAAAVAKRKGRKASSTVEKFVTAWNGSRNYSTFMRKFGMSPHSVSKYRRIAVAEGHTLKALKGSRTLR